MKQARSRSAAAAVTALFLLALGASAAAGADVTPQQIATKWAWVTVRMPTTAAYDPAPRDQGNSTDSTNHVSYLGSGRYQVTLEHVGDPGGIVHVTPLGATTNVCEVVGWEEVGPDVVVDVGCYTRLGAGTAQRFSLSFLATNATAGKLAYLWADQHQTPLETEYTPDPTYSYNSKGGTNTIRRLDTGQYWVVLPDLGSMKGSVQVTAYETTDTTAPPPTSTGVGPATAVLPSVCNVARWHPWEGDMVVDVFCRDSNGAPTDSRFDLTFMQNLGLKGYGGDDVAYLFANRRRLSSYTPDAAFSFSSAGRAPSVTRQGIGLYTVTLPGMPKGGGVQVSAVGVKAKRCVAKSISLDTSPQRIAVRCYGPAGTLVDEKFTLAYER